MTTPSMWDLIDAEVREYSVNGDQRAKDLFAKAIAAAEARGYARAQDNASSLIHSDGVRDFLGGYAPVDKDLNRMVR